MREATPVEVLIERGSIAMGSDATPTVMIGDFVRAHGTIETSDSRSKFDEYKTIYDLHFERSTVLLRSNVDYSGPLLDHGKKVCEALESDISQGKREKEKVWRKRRTLHRVFVGNDRLKLLTNAQALRGVAQAFAFVRDPTFSSPPISGTNVGPWQGLRRYRDVHGNQPVQSDQQPEYAKVLTILDTIGSLDLVYYADVPGMVPRPDQVEHIDEADEIGNVDLPPEYGINVKISDAQVNYGPWTDRQREAIQRALSPAIFYDTVPHRRLQHGDRRIHSGLLVRVELTGTTRLRMPTREPSKVSPTLQPSHSWLNPVRIGSMTRLHRHPWLGLTAGLRSLLATTLQ